MTSLQPFAALLVYAMAVFTVVTFLLPFLYWRFPKFILWMEKAWLPLAALGTVVTTCTLLPWNSNSSSPDMGGPPGGENKIAMTSPIGVYPRVADVQHGADQNIRR